MKSDSLSAIKEIRRDYLQHYSIKYFEKQREDFTQYGSSAKTFICCF
jgi:hypothetical protein